MFNRVAPLIFSILSIFTFSGYAIADEANDPAPIRQPAAKETSLELNQPYMSKKLGQITFPFMWNITEQNNRIVATEPVEDDPAVVTVDFIDYPADLSTDKMSLNILTSLAQTISGPAVEQSAVTKETSCFDEKPSNKCKNSVDSYTATFSGTDQNIERACSAALYFIKASHKLVAYTICASSTKSYNISPVEGLKNMFNSMQ